MNHQSAPDHLPELPRWTCSRCQETRIGPSGPACLCPMCERQVEEERIRNLPKAEALKHTKIPHSMRGQYDWLQEPWPRDPRQTAGKIDPLSWPKQVADSATDVPPLLTLSASNGSGKSTRAAHLLYLLHRYGVRPNFWVTEMQLAEERENFGSKPLFNRAVESRGLVIDELGSTRGRKSDVELALGVMLKLIDRRLQLGRPTICTTHRPLSKAGAKSRGQLETESLEAIAPAIYDRLRAGLMIGLENKSFRSRWATGDAQ